MRRPPPYRPSAEDSRDDLALPFAFAVRPPLEPVTCEEAPGGWIRILYAALYQPL